MLWLLVDVASLQAKHSGHKVVIVDCSWAGWKVRHEKRRDFDLMFAAEGLIQACEPDDAL